jgi:hypothetical protein
VNKENRISPLRSSSAKGCGFLKAPLRLCGSFISNRCGENWQLATGNWQLRLLFHLRDYEFFNTLQFQRSIHG